MPAPSQVFIDDCKHNHQNFQPNRKVLYPHGPSHHGIQIKAQSLSLFEKTSDHMHQKIDTLDGRKRCHIALHTTQVYCDVYSADQ